MAVAQSMDFFAHQDAARRSTTVLIAYYALAVVMIIAGVYFAIAGTFLGVKTKTTGEMDIATLWDPTLALCVVGGTLVIVLLGTIYKVSQLSGGGEAVASMLGGRRISPNTTTGDERKILNVVEEMSIAAGMAVPPVFIMDDELGINAFAAGFSPDDAVVAVTRGCVQQLSRDELQGVVAHEFSHILNGDMRLNIRLMGVLHGILIIALIGYTVMRTTMYSSGRSRSRDSKGSNMPIVVMGLALMVIGYVGVFFGKMIKSAVSRQREYLADASAVQFTRNPEGISGALKKIGGYAKGSRLGSSHAEEASHFFFANGVSRVFFNMMATHPPLDERIRRLDPSFAVAGAAAPPPMSAASTIAAPVSGFAVNPAQVATSVGAPKFEHLAHAATVMAGLPVAMSAGAREPFGARAVVYALLLNESETAYTRQLDRLKQHSDAAVYDETLKFTREAGELRAEQRLPLADIAVSTLRNLSADQFQEFRDNVEHLVAADEQIDLFEYALQRMILRRLQPVFGQVRPDVIKYHKLDAILPSAADLLSCLAYWGTEDVGEAERAFRTGMLELGAGEDVRIGELQKCGLDVVDKSLAVLGAGSPSVKKQLIEACTACIGCDGRVTVEEAELLRSIGDALGCPIPPFLPGQQV